MTSPAGARTSSIKPSLWAISLGLFTALLSYLIAFAQGMASAPSYSGQWALLAMAAVGIGLTGLGLISLRTTALRPLAGKSAMVILCLLAGAMIVDMLLKMTGLNDG